MEPRRPRLDHVAPERPRGAEGRHLRRGAPLGLRGHRARDLGFVALRRRASPRRARRSRSAAGSPRCVGTKEEPKLGAYAVTEPQAGSDVKSLRTTAKRDGDDWILNGTKTFISNGGIADVTVVVATVDPELGHRGQASFIVTEDNPGLELGQKESKLGIRASQTAEIVLEDCRVPGDALLGGEEKLQKKLERARSGKRSRASGALATFEITRPTVGASALGIAQAAYEWTLEYLSGRYDNGRPLLQEQRIQQVIADVATEIEAARLLVWRAAWMGRNGVPMTGGQGSMSKLKGGDVDDVGDDHADGPGRPGGAEHRLPAREVVPRRQDLPDLRGHGPDPAARHRAHAGGRVRGAPAVREAKSRATNGAVASQAPGNAPPETPAAGEREKVATA